MSVETYPELNGKSILFVEASAYLRAVKRLSNNFEMIDMYIMPTSKMLKFMNDRSIDAAIIHPSALREEEIILEIHNAGLPVIAIIKDPPISEEYGDMYKRLESKGIVAIVKDEGCYIEALNELSRLFNETSSS